MNSLELARKNAELSKPEEQVFREMVLKLEESIAEKDGVIKLLTSKIRKPQFYSPLDLRSMRKRRTKLKKERRDLKIKLDLLQK